MTAGMYLKIERVKVGATQRDVARHMGVSASRVSVIERTGLTARTSVDPETVKRYKEALSAIVAEQKSGVSTTWRVEMMSGIGTTQEQYKAAKAQARADVRRHPAIRTFEVQIHPGTPAATVIGYLDGLAAAGGSSVLLDGDGTVVNRRIG